MSFLVCTDKSTGDAVIIPLDSLEQVIDSIDAVTVVFNAGGSKVFDKKSFVIVVSDKIVFQKEVTRDSDNYFPIDFDITYVSKLGADNNKTFATSVYASNIREAINVFYAQHRGGFTDIISIVKR